MLEANKRLVYDGEAMLNVLKEIEEILGSLHKMGAYYALKDWEGVDKPEFDRETNDYINNNRVCGKLARIRTILSEKFDDTRGEDDMDDIERACKDIVYWKAPRKDV